MLKSFSNGKMGKIPGLTGQGLTQAFSTRFRMPRPLTPYQLEMQKFKKAMTVARKRAAYTYWTRQTELENEFIENFIQEKKEKIVRDQIKLRNRIVRHSSITLEHMKATLLKRADKQEKYKRWLLGEQEKAQKRHDMIQLMNIDSQSWFSEIEDLQDKLKQSLLIPNVIGDSTTYYEKLEWRAGMAESLNYEELSASFDAEKIQKYRNALLIPLFTEIKSAIKHLTHSRQYEILNDFEAAKATVLTSATLSKAEKVAKVESLKEKYRLLLEISRMDDKKPNAAIKIMTTQIEALKYLMDVWEHYSEILLIPNEQIHSMMEEELSRKRQGQETEAKVEDWSDDMVSMTEPDTSDSSESEEEVSASFMAEQHAKKEEFKDFLAEGEGDEAITIADSDEETIELAEEPQVDEQKEDDLFASQQDDTLAADETEELASLKPEAMQTIGDVESSLEGLLGDDTATPSADDVNMYGDRIVSSYFGHEEISTRDLRNLNFQSFPDLLEESVTAFSDLHATWDVNDPTETQTDSENTQLSIVLDAFKRRVEALDSSKLNSENQAKKDALLQKIDLINNSSIREPRVLFSILQKHRYIESDLDAPIKLELLGNL